MQGNYHLALMGLSVAIAIFGAYISLALINGTQQFTAKTKGLRAVMAGITFATGIWSMHFVGMLALQLPIQLSFDPLFTLLSYLMAVAGAVPAMLIFSFKRLTLLRQTCIACLLAGAISAMHYTGMASLLIQPAIIYNPTLVFASITIAFLAAFLALSIVYRWQTARQTPLLSQVFTALLLGGAISSMHYTGMSAAYFLPTSVSLAVTSGISANHLAYAVTSATLLIMLMFLFTTLQHKQYIISKVLLIVAVSEMTVLLLLPSLLASNTPWYIGYLINVFLLTLLVSPVAWRLKKTLTTSLSNQQDIEENLHGQQAVNQLLSLPLLELEIEELLDRALKIILDLPWLKVLPKGAIFLSDSDQQMLTMIAEHELAPEIIKSCAKVAYGQCCCGIAASRLKTQHHSHVDAEHTTGFENMPDHGHYNVPLLMDDTLYGVLCLYLPPGHQIKQNEPIMLTTLASTVAGLVARKQAQQQLQLAQTVFEHNLTCLMVTDTDNRILNVNPAFSRVTGYSVQEVIGKTPAILKSGAHEQSFYRDMWQALHEQGQWEGEVWNKRKDGEAFPEWLNISTVKDHKGSIRNYVAAFADTSARLKAEARIKQLAFYDPLTGLANRTLFDDRITRALTEAKRYFTQFSLLFIDLDRFKDVNDTLGHNVGDEFLKEVSSRLQSCLRDSDTLARFGGDEFVAILKESLGHHEHSLSAGQRVAESIILKLSQPFEHSGYTFQSGASIGIVIFPDDGDNSVTLLQRADAAMYEAKNAGRNTYRFFSQTMADKIARRLSMEQALRLAIDKDQLTFVYQPLVEIENNTVIAAEALLRWQHPQFGSVAPHEFIKLAEACGLIVSIGDWCFTQVCQQLSLWDQNAAKKLQKIALNISIHQLKHQQFATRFKQIAEQAGIDPQRIELEISEAGLAQYPDDTQAILNALRAVGFKLTIDDFGTDYSSLHRLRAFKVDLLKIDSSFIKEMTYDDAAIVKAIIEMADALGLNTLAEGVETAEQLQLLKHLGCHRAQGYYFGKPVPAEEFSQRFLVG